MADDEFDQDDYALLESDNDDFTVGFKLMQNYGRPQHSWEEIRSDIYDPTGVLGKHYTPTISNFGATIERLLHKARIPDKDKDACIEYLGGPHAHWLNLKNPECLVAGLEYKVIKSAIRQPKRPKSDRSTLDEIAETYGVQPQQVMLYARYWEVAYRFL